LHDGRCRLLLGGEVELREEREEDLDAADRVQRRVNGMSDYGFHILKNKKEIGFGKFCLLYIRTWSNIL
jgi:hypothetical protein